ncbi:hypothetical protein G9A89_011508 [Geosiphon pyriformis]|nr:hypothetical protein G9A89_011508 [Geosiphon pyriformis]
MSFQLILPALTSDNNKSTSQSLNDLNVDAVISTDYNNELIPLFEDSGTESDLEIVWAKTLPFALPSPPKTTAEELVNNLLLKTKLTKNPRMPNEFFIYRKVVQKELQAHIRKHKVRMTEVSRIAADSWKIAPRRIKTQYRKIAREVEQLYMYKRNSMVFKDSITAEPSKESTKFTIHHLSQLPLLNEKKLRVSKGKRFKRVPDNKCLLVVDKPSPIKFHNSLPFPETTSIPNTPSHAFSSPIFPQLLDNDYQLDSPSISVISSTFNSSNETPSTQAYSTFDYTTSSQVPLDEFFLNNLELATPWTNDYLDFDLIPFDPAMDHTFIDQPSIDLLQLSTDDSNNIVNSTTSFFTEYFIPFDMQQSEFSTSYH